MKATLEQLSEVRKLHNQWITHETWKRKDKKTRGEEPPKGKRLVASDYAPDFFVGAYLYGADLSGADLRGANLRGADLKEADLQEANLKWANLQRAILREADLRWANLQEANLRGGLICRGLN